MAIIKLTDEVIEKLKKGPKLFDLKEIVKALVENSIDAKASKIEVNLLDGGTKEIKVSDDGEGMSPTDAKFSLFPFTTSRISSVLEYNQPRFLGRRGCSLFEISTVSSVKISTAIAGKKGIMFTARGGKIISEALVTRPNGTDVTIRQIFHNNENLLEKLNETTKPFEMAKIAAFLLKTSICYPRIRFKVTNNNKVILETSGSGDVLEVVKVSYGQQISNNLIRIFGENQNFRISGFIAPATELRATKDNVHLFLNGRIVENNSLIAAVREGYRPQLTEGKYPICIINVETPFLNVSYETDQNDLALVKEEASLLELIIATINKQLLKKETNQKTQDALIKNDYSLVTDLFTENKEEYLEFNEDIKKIPSLQYIGEAFNKYLITSAEDALYIIDKDKAFQLLFYHKILKGLKSLEITNFTLSKPLFIPLDSEDIAVLLTLNENNYFYGITYNVKENGLEITSVPSFVNPQEALEFCKALLESEIKYKDEEKHKFLVTASEKISERLVAFYPRLETIKEITFLLEDLVLLNNPYATPSGDLVVVKLDQKELKSWFQKRI